ncbi:UDP-N-acetylmuramate:L-alanyl-gamma-D-glutamyl-meso-diaminopimelate ligase [Sulfurifustis variabilis]|uniref:UDP-N-acetylmuramate--L-alanyl-gamma-D-glutamyl-meso-2,6-diaminoheptandioate ligase n=1 Tax=Sulfurifustis variabilis TaxID=1675686 RepID=A0A1B4V2E9_9GAMM|nr:UDP-N-acetylmuramate:L-alanyl-gamma-D-glutamyl-meso-diaminopimelate ligase [Sulfurifustis variabilis]BAU46612.1 UDP-N-acetylmuramate:L-alanyl-gamma-D-glutamyl-meso-diaminopimelate ligase [Sulfurifustis variabilis]
MHVHILGIGGTFMAGVALLARALGHRVTGSDKGLYPPMSTQLQEQGVEVREGYEPSHLDPRPDSVVIGNALSRGNALVEAVLDADIPYTSGAQWVAEHALAGRWTLAVAGTHGKTTTSAMLAWILEYAGLKPGFLIGGVPTNFGISARLGEGRHFVIEADEYDTAFFDKRSKFVHYRPRTAVLNNLEYDHADIFPDLDSIKRQFHHLVRTVPPSGRLVVNAADANLRDVLEAGCWTPVERFGGESEWRAELIEADGSRFRVVHRGNPAGEVRWRLYGAYNVDNALAALAAAHHAGVPVDRGCAALTAFQNARRRLEVRGEANGVTVYDDFAHHPTAIRLTLEALRQRVGDARLIAVLEPRSNTMRLGVHRDTLGPALVLADRVYLFRPNDLTWNLERVTRTLDGRGRVLDSVAAIIDALAAELRPGDHVLVMSNGGFENLHARLLDRLGGS